MSLRLRLSLILGSAFVLLWSLAAAWMLYDLRNQTMLALDQRLAASARMVAGLMAQLPPLAELPGQRLSAEQLGIANGLACQVSSLRGEVLARSHATPDKQLDATDKGFRTQWIEGAPWRSFTLQQGELRITTADRVDERALLERSIWLSAAVPATVALLGSLAILWLGIGHGLAPLTRIREALARRSADDLEPLSLHTLPGELQPLVDSQNQLFRRIARALERERSLTDDAAHELRSPLTAIKTHLQVARMTDGAIAAQALAHAEEGADRLQRTLEQLLLLARVEGDLPFDDYLPAQAEALARQALADADPHGQRIDLRLADGLTEQPLALPAPLAVAALRNLLDNAVRHTPPDSAVELQVDRLDAGVRFSVRDHGPGIAEAHLHQVTRRFWRQAGSQGSGLGLAIIQAIAQRCGGRLDFANHPDGLRASLWVPLQTASTERDPPDLGSPRKRTFPDKPDAEGNQPWQAGPATPR